MTVLYRKKDVLNSASKLNEIQRRSDAIMVLYPNIPADEWNTIKKKYNIPIKLTPRQLESKLCCLSLSDLNKIEFELAFHDSISQTEVGGIKRRYTEEDEKSPSSSSSSSSSSSEEEEETSKKKKKKSKKSRKNKRIPNEVRQEYTKIRTGKGENVFHQISEFLTSHPDAQELLTIDVTLADWKVDLLLNKIHDKTKFTMSSTLGIKLGATFLNNVANVLITTYKLPNDHPLAIALDFARSIVVDKQLNDLRNSVPYELSDNDLVSHDEFKRLLNPSIEESVRRALSLKLKSLPLQYQKDVIVSISKLTMDTKKKQRIKEIISTMKTEDQIESIFKYKYTEPVLYQMATLIYQPILRNRLIDGDETEDEEEEKKEPPSQQQPEASEEKREYKGIEYDELDDEIRNLFSTDPEQPNSPSRLHDDVDFMLISVNGMPSPNQELPSSPVYDSFGINNDDEEKKTEESVLNSSSRRRINNSSQSPIQTFPTVDTIGFYSSGSNINSQTGRRSKHQTVDQKVMILLEQKQYCRSCLGRTLYQMSVLVYHRTQSKKNDKVVSDSFWKQWAIQCVDIISFHIIRGKGNLSTAQYNQLIVLLYLHYQDPSHKLNKPLLLLLLYSLLPLFNEYYMQAQQQQRQKSSQMMTRTGAPMHRLTKDRPIQLLVNGQVVNQLPLELNDTIQQFLSGGSRDFIAYYNHWLKTYAKKELDEELEEVTTSLKALIAGYEFPTDYWYLESWEMKQSDDEKHWYIESEITQAPPANPAYDDVRYANNQHIVKIKEKQIELQLLHDEMMRVVDEQLNPEDGLFFDRVLTSEDDLKLVGKEGLRHKIHSPDEDKTRLFKLRSIFQKDRNKVRRDYYFRILFDDILCDFILFSPEFQTRFHLNGYLTSHDYKDAIGIAEVERTVGMMYNKKLLMVLAYHFYQLGLKYYYYGDSYLYDPYSDDRILTNKPIRQEQDFWIQWWYICADDITMNVIVIIDGNTPLQRLYDRFLDRPDDSVYPLENWEQSVWLRTILKDNQEYVYKRFEGYIKKYGITSTQSEITHKRKNNTDEEEKEDDGDDEDEKDASYPSSKRTRIAAREKRKPIQELDPDETEDEDDEIEEFSDTSSDSEATQNDDDEEDESGSEEDSEEEAEVEQVEESESDGEVDDISDSSDDDEKVSNKENSNKLRYPLPPPSNSMDDTVTELEAQLIPFQVPLSVEQFAKFKLCCTIFNRYKDLGYASKLIQQDTSLNKAIKTRRLKRIHRKKGYLIRTCNQTLKPTAKKEKKTKDEDWFIQLQHSSTSNLQNIVNSIKKGVYDEPMESDDEPEQQPKNNISSSSSSDSEPEEEEVEEEEEDEEEYYNSILEQRKRVKLKQLESRIQNEQELNWRKNHKPKK